MTFLTRKGFLIEELGMTYLADTDPDLALGPPGWLSERAGQR